MTYSDSTHAGSPFGARWDDNYHQGPAPRTERYDVTHPWGAEPCEQCARATARGSRRGGCPTCYPLPSPVAIPGAPDPDVRLPCTDRQEQFWVEEVTAEHRMLCGSCPFQDWCLETAIANGEHYVWAATSRADRKELVLLREGNAA
jgi:hypothetical protein